MTVHFSEFQATVASMREERLHPVTESSDPWDHQDPQAFSGGRVGLGPGAGDLFFHSFGRHNAQVSSRAEGSYPPFYSNELEHQNQVDAARLLEGLCPTAANVLDILTMFCIHTGFEYEVVRKKRATASDTLIRKAQDVIDLWMKANRWPSWEREIFRRTRRDGEAILYLEPDDATDLFLLRSVEPEQVREPADIRSLNGKLGRSPTDSWRYGILTSKINTAVPEAYWVTTRLTDTKILGEYVPAEEILHIRSEWIDRVAKRGVSDFFSVANEIFGTKKLLRGLREGGTVQSHIVWVRTEAKDVQPAAAGTGQGKTRGGERLPAIVYDSPTVLTVRNGTTYTPGPLVGPGKSDTLIKILQAALRNIGARWQLPESLISGDSSNNNLASALVSEAPLVRSMIYRQSHYKVEYRMLMERVLDYAASRGMLGPARDTYLDVLAVNVEAMPVVPRKLLEETKRNSVLSAAGVLSRSTWATREDLDLEEEQAAMAEQSPTVAAAGELSLVPEGESIL